MQQYKHIPVFPDTYKKIVRYGRKDDSFDDIITRLFEHATAPSAEPDGHDSMQMTLSIPQTVFEEIKLRIENGMRDKDGPIGTVEEAVCKILDLWLKDNKYNVFVQQQVPKISHNTGYGIREEASEDEV